ncbi:hypothetical protein POVCU2_0044290 [Plasmodium ovale curtisi]|uniref:Uncharacterized protein n=1 Tax=Plasmodium ovale curtisi TaxID=864141 RepID=A0A1A8W7U1_PLAOA|nr:hypothetical protein POVCU2_0044290 [Plasmodium ovale curtisi]SBS97780.1 hypothetical protein POVCU1_040930 [Plasmodium ovale curtisi]
MAVQQTDKAEVRREDGEEKYEVKLKKRLCRCSRIVLMLTNTVCTCQMWLSVQLNKKGATNFSKCECRYINICGTTTCSGFSKRDSNKV